MSTRADFNRIARKRAKFIGDDGLKEESGWSQIDEKAWPALKKINARGLITTDSQAGHHNLERAYITGYMWWEDVENFVEYLNIWSDKVAFYTFLIQGDYTSSIPVTRDYRKDKESWISFTALPLYPTRETMTADFERVGFPEDAKVIAVSVFDPKWGRPCWSRKGLFRDVLEALRPKTHTMEELWTPPEN